MHLDAGYKFGIFFKSHSLLKLQLVAIHVQICAADSVLKVLRIDNELETEAIRTWVALCAQPITLETCVTHEHHSIGDLERFNGTLGDTINKKLYGKPHLTKPYWGYA